MSTATIPSASRLQQSRGNAENKRAMSGKTRNRTAQQSRIENPTLAHPGKSVSSQPAMTTPRKPLSLIGNNARELPSFSSTKSVTAQKAKTTVSRLQKHKKQCVSKAPKVVVQPAPRTVKSDDYDDIPEIETASRRLDEPDEFDIGRFVPPDYFHTMTTLLKKPVVFPPHWAYSSSSVSSRDPSLSSEPDVSIGQEASEVSYSREDIGLPDTLPDLPDLDLW